MKRGCFYKTCAIFPVELADDSPCKSHSQPLVGSPTIGVPVAQRITEDTGAFYTKTNGKRVIGKGRTCYLGEYNPETQVGVIFLGTSKKDVAHENRFLPVYGGKVDKDGLPMSGERNFLLTDPPDAFKTNFYVNLSHPLRVQVVFVNEISDVKYMHLPLPPPPPVGMKSHRFEGTSTGEVRLNPTSETTFWEVHRRYHKERPKASGGRVARWSTGIDGLGVEVLEASKEVDAVVGGKGDVVEGGKGQSIHAPWGMVGDFRIGFDIPLLLSDVSDSDSEDSDSDDEWKTIGDQEDLSIGSVGTTNSDAYDHIAILRDIENKVGDCEIGEI